MVVRVLLVDDHLIVREGIRFSLEKLSGIEVVAEADNGRMALKLVEEFLPDVVLMDVVMPDMNGIEATRRIVSNCPGSRVLIFSGHSDMQMILGALKAGARGFIMKSCCSIQELVRAIQSVAANGTYFSSPVTESILRDYMEIRSKDTNGSVVQISPREREILQLLAEGKNTKEIAFVLEVSAKTVDTHRKHIMNKLKVGSIAELTKFAIREGLTPL
ncbi:MAG: response regulator transcription factor [Geobacteraceae bacterium]|nr:response regulator transcription factor [Geobacteraceae bacterium]